MRVSSSVWQKILAQGFGSASELLQFLELPQTLGNLDAQLQFPTRVPRGFANKMEKGNPQDPLLLQVLALDQELEFNSSFSVDPLQEAKANPVQGLLHKYQGRVLVTFSGACAINCRYCFRRHFPYQDNTPGRRGTKEILEYIQKDPGIHEVILSGGDPLLATDVLLGDFLSQLDTIGHVQTLRFHSRIPVVLPERIDDGFLKVLNASRLRKVMVLHCNHARELDQTVFEKLQLLRAGNVHLLNQSVLLKGINANAATLIELSHKLFSFGVLPYYLHLLDKVQGTTHFDIPLEEALGLFKAIQTQLPGYLVPRLAKEVPGEKHKLLVGLV